MKHTPLMTALALAALFNVPAIAGAAQGDAAAAGAAELDVTMTVVPDDAAVSEAVAGVIALPAQAAAQAQEHAQAGISTANQAIINHGGSGQEQATEVHGALGGGVSVDAGAAADAAATGNDLHIGMDGTTAADANANADVGAGLAGGAAEMREQMGGGVGATAGGGLGGGLHLP